MAKLSVDFSDVKSFEAIPKGEYLCVINEAKVVHPESEDKYPYVQLVLKVTEDGEYKDRTLWARWSLSPKALFRMKNDLDNLGMPADEVDFEYDEDSDMVTSPELVGMPCLATVKVRQYQGADTNDVEVLRAVDSGKVGEKKGKALAGGRGKRAFAK